MPDGPSAANANAALSTLTGSMADIQLHIGAPGANGTANQSSVTTREAVTWGSPSGGVISASNQPAWTNWGGTNGEIETDISFWSASSGGTFEYSMQLAASVPMDTGDSLTLTSIMITAPVAS